MRCEEIMKRDVRSIDEGDDVLLAARIMRDEGIGFLPVRDVTGGVSGVVTDRDIAVRVCAEELPPGVTPIGSIMSRGTISCLPTHTVTHAEQLMREHHLTRIIIMDEQRRLLGIVSFSDVVQYERPSRAGITARAIAERKYSPERP